MVGGAEVAIKEITDRISSKEFEFDMITLQFNSKLPRFEKIGNVNVYRIGFTQKFPLKINKYIFPFIAFWKAFRLQRKKKYAGIWAMMANYAGFATVFFKMAYPKIPYLLTLQEGDPITYIKKRVRFVYPIFRQIFARADIIQTISNYLAGFARDMGYNGPLKIVPNGVDTALFSKEIPESELNALKEKLGKKADEKFIITTSRLVLKNAVDDVIKSLVFLPSNYRFLVLGVGPDMEMLKALAQKEGVEKRVSFLGQVNHSGMPKYLKVSDVFTRPSLSEGFGNSFVEAMAAEVPVVATPVGGIPDFLFDLQITPNKEPTGLFCNLRDPRDLAEKIERIIRDDALRARIIKNAKEMVMEKYDWVMIAKDMKDIFEGLKLKCLLPLTG